MNHWLKGRKEVITDWPGREPGAEQVCIIAFYYVVLMYLREFETAASVLKELKEYKEASTVNTDRNKRVYCT